MIEKFESVSWRRMHRTGRRNIEQGYVLASGSWCRPISSLGKDPNIKSSSLWRRISPLPAVSTRQSRCFILIVILNPPPRQSYASNLPKPRPKCTRSPKPKETPNGNKRKKRKETLSEHRAKFESREPAYTHTHTKEAKNLSLLF